MVSGYQNGIIAQLLQAIIGQNNFDGEPISNIGDILLSILEHTPYDEEPKSVLAELFLKLKAKLENEPFEPYDKEPTSVIAEILLSILNVTPYDKEPNSRIAELLLELKAKLESYVELTASGSICNFTTSLALPLVSVKSAIVATGGGGTPSTPIAINGFSEAVIRRSGANLFDEVMELGVLDNNGNIQSSSTNLVSTNKFAVKGGATLYFSCVKKTSTNQRYGVAFYDKDENFISGSGSIVQTNTFTPPQNACFMRFFVPLSWYVSSTYENDISINGVSTDTAYHAYNPNSATYTLALGQTVYGGEVDATNGKVKITHEIVDLGNLTWRLYTGTHPYWWTDDLKPVIKKASVNSEVMNITCSCFSKTSSVNISSGAVTSGIAIHTDGAVRIVYPDMPTTQDDLISEIEGNNFVYPLATPTTELDITPQEITALVGVNNLWSDTGDSEVVYLAEISDNIEQTSKARAAVKAEKELKAKLEKELKELDEKETIKEPTKEIGETKK